MSKKIITRAENYSDWYIDVVTRAQLADYAPAKGCMVIRPNGYEIWEKIQSVLDNMFKDTGHRNAYFPLLIPESFLQKEAEHVEGFAPECAVVTHGGGKKLTENLMIRPTSETIIWHMYSKWINSHRDLPLLINQWCNVVRWEMRTRLFLRTTEFLWQEGHTAHATKEEAEEETLKMLHVYKTFAEEYMAMPVVAGLKTESEKFPGAVNTYTIEAMMQDKKALQAGTSHFLGQNFAKAFNVTFQNESGERQHVWATSWGVSTRLVGALIMCHSDDQGLILPPKLAARQVVIIPIWKGEEDASRVIEYAHKIKDDLSAKFNVHVDDRRQYKPGWKFNEWELLGMPLRIEIGPRDLDSGNVVLSRRDKKEKFTIPLGSVLKEVGEMLDNMQKDLFQRARDFREANTFVVDDFQEFRERNEENGFYRIHWCGMAKCEEKIKEETKATIRCIPLDAVEEKGRCIVCGAASSKRVLAGRAY